MDTRQDKILWCVDKEEIFTVNKAWEYFRTSNREVNWHRVIWFPKHVPRRSFAWLAILKRLHTQDRLLQFGKINSMSCMFCRDCIKDHKHLFFSCQFTFRIWSFLLGKCDMQWHGNNWKQTIGWICSQTVENNFRNLILKFVFGAIIYQICIERNDRLCRNLYKDVLCVQKHVFNLVRCRIMGFKHIPFSQGNR
ncbi:hypothetical protein Pfo_030791 [Paulownia fortunei]|nr:hypothetical protein Pfo_030791 [Paulownia fortunei]